jgi:plasmid stabilization system protein ParE
VRYELELSGAALHDIGMIHEFLHEDDPAFADRWLVGLYRAVATLRELPHRCRVVPDAALLGHPVRQLLYRQYLVRYIVSDERVVIVHVRHSSW